MNELCMVVGEINRALSIAITGLLVRCSRMSIRLHTERI